MAINIPLFENWRVRSDKNNVMLVQEQNGREFIEGFYSTMEGCIDAFVEKKIRGCDASSIFGLMNYIKSLQTALNNALQPLKLVCVPISDIEKLKGEQKAGVRAPAQASKEGENGKENLA